VVLFGFRYVNLILDLFVSIIKTISFIKGGAIMLSCKKLCLFVSCLLALALLSGCAGMSKAPDDRRPGYLAYPTEMVQADMDLAAARAAGKDKECPDEFNAAKATIDKAYEVYMTCRTEDAIALANKAIEMIKALCPQKYVAPPPPPPPAEPVVLKDINFDFDKATLTKQAVSILRENIATLKANRGIAVRIEGHTCAHGADDYNMRLGDRRAGAVKEFLAKEGKISESRMSTISYGETRLLMPETPTPKNKDSVEAKANRRVHFEAVSR
jgi:outer membrane protein OmpA-like peptidoglycan-associated protein